MWIPHEAWRWRLSGHRHHAPPPMTPVPATAHKDFDEICTRFGNELRLRFELIFDDYRSGVCRDREMLIQTICGAPREDARETQSCEIDAAATPHIERNLTPSSGVDGDEPDETHPAVHAGLCSLYGLYAPTIRSHQNLSAILRCSPPAPFDHRVIAQLPQSPGLVFKVRSRASSPSPSELVVESAMNGSTCPSLLCPASIAQILLSDLEPDPISWRPDGAPLISAATETPEFFSQCPPDPREFPSQRPPHGVTRLSLDLEPDPLVSFGNPLAPGTSELGFRKPPDPSAVAGLRQLLCEAVAVLSLSSSDRPHARKQ